MAEYAYLVVYPPRGTSRDARDTARRILADHAEYGDWELSRLRLNADGSREGYPPKAHHTPSPHIVSSSATDAARLGPGCFGRA
jgi:Family of unknown function (DUF5703)